MILPNSSSVRLLCSLCLPGLFVGLLLFSTGCGDHARVTAYEESNRVRDEIGKYLDRNLTTNFSTIVSNLNSFQKELAEVKRVSDQERKSFNARIEVLNKQNEELAGLRTNVAALQTKVTTLMTNNQALQHKDYELTAQVKNLRKEKNQLAEQMEEYEKRKQLLDKDELWLIKQKGLLRAENAKLEGKLETLKRDQQWEKDLAKEAQGRGEALKPKEEKLNQREKKQAKDAKR